MLIAAWLVESLMDGLLVFVLDSFAELKCILSSLVNILDVAILTAETPLREKRRNVSFRR